MRRCAAAVSGARARARIDAIKEILCGVLGSGADLYLARRKVVDRAPERISDGVDDAVLTVDGLPRKRELDERGSGFRQRPSHFHKYVAQCLNQLVRGTAVHLP